ncbi:MAG: hypothetical protein ACTSXJ_09720 [Candidatus Baldrarchaeia archaeon]
MRFWRRFKEALKNIIYGMTVADMVQTMRKKKWEIESALLSITIGDMMGLPVNAPIYKYVFLVYYLPRINAWMRYIARERDFLEKE